jgi:two-component system chemotaxis response regulator CheY
VIIASDKHEEEMAIEKRVLVVDDDDAIRALLCTILRRRGLPVDSARNGAEALARCEQCRYAVVLLDLMMPQLNGYEVLNAFGKRKREDRPLILVLTAGAEPRNLSADLVAGTIRKPFDVEMIVDTISAALTTLANREQLEECPPADSDMDGCGLNPRVN